MTEQDERTFREKFIDYQIGGFGTVVFATNYAVVKERWLDGMEADEMLTARTTSVFLTMVGLGALYTKGREKFYEWCDENELMQMGSKARDMLTSFIYGGVYGYVLYDWVPKILNYTGIASVSEPSFQETTIGVASTAFLTGALGIFYAASSDLAREITGVGDPVIRRLGEYGETMTAKTRALASAGILAATIGMAGTVIATTPEENSSSINLEAVVEGAVELLQ